MGNAAGKQLLSPPYSLQSRWWTSETVAVVTGANKGIGYHIARGLAAAGLLTVLTSRNPVLGEEAVKKLHAEGKHNVVYHQLDVTDRESIDGFARWVRETYQGVGILVNNAGVITRGGGVFGVMEGTGADVARATLATNYRGVRDVTEALIPLLQGESESGARIVNVSSTLGRVSILSPALQERLLDPDLNLDQLDELAAEFVRAQGEGSWKEQGWSGSSYGVSKALLNAYNRVLAKSLSAHHQAGRRVFVNAYSPGWCATDLGSFLAPMTAEEGADTGLYLALLPAAASTTGEIYRDRAKWTY